MKELERVLTFWAIPRWLSGPGGPGISSLGAPGLACGTDLGRITGRPRSPWIRFALAILFVLLAPWGGLCERRSRVADPTTSRLETLGSQGSDWQTGVHGRGHDPGLPGIDRDILDDEDSEEETGSRSFVGRAQEFVPSLPGALGPLELQLCRDDSGHPARSPILRC